MLSTGAFNALLKTLEEPPAHVIFVLATTEVHKLPATILSRCQRFDFSRIQPEDIAARIQYIAEQEQFSVTEDAAILLARLADGALRDALSLLDQCVSRSRDVTADIVAETTGMAGREYLYDMSAAIRTGNGGAGLALIDQLYQASRDMERLCAELIEYFRNLMIAKSVEDPSDFIIVPPAEMDRIRLEAEQFEIMTIFHSIGILQQTLERLRSGVSRRVEMEMAILRLCSPELDTSGESMLRRLKAVENALRSGQVMASPESALSSMKANRNREPVQDTYESESTGFAKSSSTQEDSLPPENEEEVAFDQWSDVLEILSGTCPPLYGVLVGSSATLRGNYVVICTDNDMFKSLVKRDGNVAILTNAIRSVSGRNCRIGMKKPQSKAADSATNDPLSAFIRKSRELGVEVDVK
jgi:DNA polymerase-3 subunit gamma/tau